MIRLTKQRFRRWLIALLGIGLCFMLFYVFRHTLLRSLTVPLIHTEAPLPADAMFVLSGGAHERPQKAAAIFRQYPMPIITTGEYTTAEMRAYGVDVSAAELNRRILVQEGVDSAYTAAMGIGTSTMTESVGILAYCQSHHYHRIIIVSSMLHTGRIYRIFRRKFAEHGIEVHVVGAEPKSYTIAAWWRSEEGLLFVNNEYIKSFVYRWMYGV